MSTYERFADVYDLFMQDAPYDRWLSYLTETFDLSALNVADIGCGTGVLTVPLARLARTCIGIDASEAMLSLAKERALEEHVRIDWLCQDICELRLPRLVELAISTCDVMNYLLTPSRLEEACKAVYKALSPGGWFIFDTIGPSRMTAFEDGYWHQIEDDAALLHETHVEDGRIEHEVHAFLMDDDGRYDRIEEHHVQHFYTQDDVLNILQSAGFSQIQVLSDFKHGHFDVADRLIFVAAV